MSLTLKSAVEAEFAKLVDDEITMITRQVMAGMMEEPRYKNQTGVVSGLRKALELLQTANDNVNKRK